jgi:hypothetical protein
MQHKYHYRKKQRLTFHGLFHLIHLKEMKEKKIALNSADELITHITRHK